MGRHVVGPFKCVEIVRRVLGHHAVEDAVEVGPHVRISVLVQGKSRRGMLYEQVEYCILYTSDAADE